MESNKVELVLLKKQNRVCFEDNLVELNNGEVCLAKDSAKKRLMPNYYIKTVPEDVEAFVAGFLIGDGMLGRLSSDRHKGMEVCIGAKDLDVAKYFGVDSVGKHYLVSNVAIAKKFKLKASQTFERELPDIVPDDMLMGLYSANGCVIRSGKRVALKATSYDIVKQVVTWLEVNGMKPYVTTNKPTKVKFSNGEYTCRESYDVNLSGLDNLVKFASKVSFVHKYKQDWLEEVIKASGVLITSVKQYTPRHCGTPATPHNQPTS
jgi:hypothetical protein